MKRLLNKIPDMLADAALLEVGVEVQTTEEHRFKAASEPRMSPLKRLFKNLEETLADTALLEEGVDIVSPNRRPRPDTETLEENLIEVAFAEAADYDYIHKAILQERGQRMKSPIPANARMTTIPALRINRLRHGEKRIEW